MCKIDDLIQKAVNLTCTYTIQQTRSQLECTYQVSSAHNILQQSQKKKHLAKLKLHTRKVK